MLKVFIVPIAVIAVTLLIAIPLALYYAWAVSYLWGWFLVPTFGAPPLSVMQIWGISLTLTLFRPRLDFEEKNTKGWQSGVTGLLLGPLLALGLGYAIRFWWM